MENTSHCVIKKKCYNIMKKWWVATVNDEGTDCIVNGLAGTQIGSRST
jgi:hypothetical protein